MSIASCLPISSSFDLEKWCRHLLFWNLLICISKTHGIPKEGQPQILCLKMQGVTKILWCAKKQITIFCTKSNLFRELLFRKWLIIDECCSCFKVRILSFEVWSPFISDQTHTKDRMDSLSQNRESLAWALMLRKSKRNQLVGGFHPFEKYARQIGSFPQVGVKIKNIWVATT